MLVKLFHGGNKLDIRDGYKGGKPGRHKYGTGLYTTNSYEWANGYGRAHYTLTCDLEPTTAAHVVEIPIKEVLDFINYNCSIKLFKQAKKDFENRESLTCERLEIYLVNNLKSFTRVAQPLVDLFVVNGCTYSIEIAGSWNKQLVKIFDFRIIKSASKSTEYNDTELPEELSRYTKKIA